MTQIPARYVAIGDVLSRWNGTGFVPVTVTGGWNADSGHWIITTTGGNIMTGFQGRVTLDPATLDAKRAALVAS